MEEKKHGIPVTSQWRMVRKRNFFAGLVISALFGFFAFFHVLFVRVPGGVTKGTPASDACLLGPSMCSCECELTYEQHKLFCGALLKPIAAGDFGVILGGGGVVVPPSAYANYTGLAGYVDDVVGNASSTTRQCIPNPPVESAEWELR